MSVFLQTPAMCEGYPAGAPQNRFVPRGGPGGRPTGRARRYPFVGTEAAGRGPNIASPTLTIVAPSSMAISKSRDIPIDSSLASGRTDRKLRAQRHHGLVGGSGVLRVERKRGDRHEPGDGQTGQILDSPGEGDGLVRRHATLRGLAGGVDLHQYSLVDLRSLGASATSASACAKESSE